MITLNKQPIILNIHKIYIKPNNKNLKTTKKTTMYPRGPTSTREYKKYSQTPTPYQPINKLPPYSSSNIKPISPYQPSLQWKNINNNLQGKKDYNDRLLSQGNQNNIEYLNDNNNSNAYYPYQNRQIVQTTTITRLEEQKKKKQQMKKKFEEIQKKVLPILNGQKNNDDDQNSDFGWFNRMEQKIMKLQTSIDLIQKQTQIKIQKRLLQTEKQWNNRIQALILSYSQPQPKKLTKASSTPKITHPSPNHIKNQHLPIDSSKQLPQQPSKQYKQQNKRYNKQQQYLQNQKLDAGYYTQKQNQKQISQKQLSNKIGYKKN